MPAIERYCEAVHAFYKDAPFRELQLQLATQTCFLKMRDLLKDACGTWLRKEHVLPLFYEAPKAVEWFKDDTLTRLAGACILLLEFGMFIPLPFQDVPTPYRPIPGDDTMCAELCVFLYRVWSAAYRASRQRVGETPEPEDIASLPASYREPVSMTADDETEVLIENEDEVFQFLDFFEWRMSNFMLNFIECNLKEAYSLRRRRLPTCGGSCLSEPARSQTWPNRHLGLL